MVCAVYLTHVIRNVVAVSHILASDFSSAVSGVFKTEVDDEMKPLFAFTFTPSANGMYMSVGEWQGSALGVYQLVSNTIQNAFTLTVVPDAADAVRLALGVGDAYVGCYACVASQLPHYLLLRHTRTAHRRRRGCFQGSIFRSHNRVAILGAGNGTVSALQMSRGLCIPLLPHNRSAASSYILAVAEGGSFVMRRLTGDDWGQWHRAWSKQLE
jgi:hypothetical protein